MILLQSSRLVRIEILYVLEVFGFVDIVLLFKNDMTVVKIFLFQYLCEKQKPPKMLACSVLFESISILCHFQ